MSSISILVTTYNRPRKLRRCLASILSQNYKDFEVIIIDDCSTEDNSFAKDLDPRIRYIRNEENQGGRHGDRVHMNRFIYELARGEYFVYVCDDDFWSHDYVLDELIEAHNRYNLSMAVGGQVSLFPDKRVFHEKAFPKEYMTSEEFLTHFSQKPLESNIIHGAVLYNRELFIKSRALTNPKGAKWQAGFELYIAPALQGDVCYIDKQMIVTEQDPENKSYNLTQLEHYRDSVKSILHGYINAPDDIKLSLAIDTFESLSRSYLAHTKQIKETGKLGLCSKENIALPVTEEDVKIERALFLGDLIG